MKLFVYKREMDLSFIKINRGARVVLKTNLANLFAACLSCRFNRLADLDSSPEAGKFIDQ